MVPEGIDVHFPIDQEGVVTGGLVVTGLHVFTIETAGGKLCGAACTYNIGPIGT